MQLERKKQLRVLVSKVIVNVTYRNRLFTKCGCVGKVRRPCMFHTSPRYAVLVVL
jgi:hypothetical protein